MKALSILLVEASPLMRSALRNVLSRIGTLIVHSGPITALENHKRKVDAVLIDVATFPREGKEVGELIESCGKFGPVVLFVRDDRIDQMIAGFRAGAVGIVKPTASEHELRRALNSVLAGSIWCETQIFQRISHYLLPVHQFSPDNLTHREREVLECVSKGESNKEIAQHLQISIQSVKVYVSNLLRKTGVPNRWSLALHAIASHDGVM